MTPAPIRLWGPEPDLFPSPAPEPLSPSCRLSLCSRRAELAPSLPCGWPRRGLLAGKQEQKCHPSDIWWVWQPPLLLPELQAHEGGDYSSIPSWIRIYKCWVYPTARYSSDTTMPMLWYCQSPGGIPFIVPRPFTTFRLLLAWAALWERCWCLQGFPTTMGHWIIHLRMDPGGTGSGCRA